MPEGRQARARTREGPAGQVGTRSLRGRGTSSGVLGALRWCFRRAVGARRCPPRAGAAGLEVLDDEVDAGGERLDVRRVDRREHGDAQLVAAELAVRLDV